MGIERDYAKIAKNVLVALGGEDNITNVSHCMTRLRFNIKDESIPSLDEINNVEGVIGSVFSGGQYQVIIGQTVEHVYNELIKQGDFSKFDISDEKLNEHKFSVNKIGSKILDSLAGCLTPLIPLLLAVSVFKLLTSLLGPSMLNLISESGDVYKLLTFVGDAGFYFFPIIVGYTASKKFGVTPVTGMFLGAILIHPTFIEMAVNQSEFKVFGLPVMVQNYSSTIIPIILSIWIMSYIEPFFKRILPTVLKTLFAPFMTILVMLPLALGVLGPAGSFLGEYISKGLLGISDIGLGFIAIALIAALWEFLVISGMHLVMISTLVIVFSTNGAEAVIMPAGVAASLSVAGMCLGVALKVKNKEEKSLSFGFLIASLIGGVTEPGLYGIGIRYKRPFVGMMAGGFAGGLYAGISGLTAYNLIPVASFLGVFNFAGGPTSNFVNGIITCFISFIVAAIVSYIVGVKKD